MLPTLVRLRPVVATGADEEDPEPPDLSLPDLPGLPPLPRELWQKILDTIGTGDYGCGELKKLCEIAGPWAELCRNGTIYDMANIARGYYGRQKTWDAVLAMYKALGVSPPGDGTPKAYFHLACGPFHEGRIGQVPHWHPFYEVALLKHVDQVTMGGKYGNARRAQLKDIPPFLSNYVAIARLIVMSSPAQVSAVPLDHPAYVELNILALRHVVYAHSIYDIMGHVPEDHPDFLKILKVALRLHGNDAFVWLNNYRDMFPDMKGYDALRAIGERGEQRKQHAKWERQRRRELPMPSWDSESDDDDLQGGLGLPGPPGPNPHPYPPTSDDEDDDEDALSQEEWNAAYNRMVERLKWL